MLRSRLDIPWILNTLRYSLDTVVQHSQWMLGSFWLHALDGCFHPWDSTPWAHLGQLRQWLDAIDECLDDIMLSKAAFPAALLQSCVIGNSTLISFNCPFPIKLTIQYYVCDNNNNNSFFTMRRTLPAIFSAGSFFSRLIF